MLTVSAGLRGRVSLGVNHEYCLCHGTEGHGHVAETVGEGALKGGGWEPWLQRGSHSPAVEHGGHLL